MDVAGVVEAVGRDVTRFQTGDEVFGKGTSAEYALAREDKLAPRPANLTFEQAAVVAISGLTALQGLRDHGRVEPGQEVLFIGAARAIDYTQEDFAEGDQRYDLILDIGGNSSLARLRSALTPEGTLVIVGGEGGGWWFGGYRSSVPGDDAVPVRGPEAGHIHLQGEPRGHDRPQGAHRIRQAHAGDRQDLPAQGKVVITV